jgi:HlyD family secretion protein
MSETQTLTPPADEKKQAAPKPADKPTALNEERPPRSRVARILMIAGIIMGVLLIWKVFFANPSLPPSIVALSGRIEGDDSAVAPKTSGKIMDITVREGDTVNAGQVIAHLDDAQVRAAEAAARAALMDAQAKAQSANEQINVLQEQLRQSELQATQSTTDAEGRVRQASALADRECMPLGRLHHKDAFR